MDIILKEILVLFLIIFITSALGYCSLRIFPIRILNSLIGYTTVGVCLMSIVTSVGFLLSIPSQIFFVVNLSCICFVVCKKNYWQKLLSIDLIIFFIGILCYKFIIFGGQEISFYFHRNPDPYGSACAYGFMNKAYSYSKMLYEFYGYTGLTEPRWIKPPLLNDVWNIPDSQLRFAADQIIGSGRIGIASTLVVIKKFIPFEVDFFNLFFSFSFVCLWSLAGIIYEHFRVLYDKFKFRESIVLKSGLFRIFTFCLIFFMPLSKIEFLEGAVPQIYSKLIIATILLLYSSLLLKDDEVNKVISSKRSNHFFGFFICIMSIYFSYPDALLFVVSIMFIPTLIHVVKLLTNLQIRRKVTKDLEFVWPLIGAFIIISCVVFIDSRLFWQLKSRLLSFNSGGALHLGLPSVMTLIGFGAKLKFSDIGSGFQPLSYGIFPAISIATLIFLVIVTVFFIHSRNSRNLLEFCCFECVPVILSFLMLLVVLFNLSIGKPISDYIYFRTTGIFITLIFPGILLVVSLVFLFRGFCNDYLKVLILILLNIFILFQFSCGNKTFIHSSRCGYMKGGCPVANFDNALFVSDEPRQELFALTTCGPFYYLTDNWQPFLNESNKMWDVYEIKTKKGKISIDQIGVYVVDRLIKVPCNTDCMKELIYQQRKRLK
jgi:hypothetical protein